MKKFLLLMAVLTLVSGVASANAIFGTCTPFELTFAAGTGGPTTETCAAVSIPSGWSFTTAEEYTIADYTGGGGSTTNTVQTMYTNSAVGATAFGGSPANCNVTGGANSSPSGCNSNYTFTPGGMGTLPFLSGNPTTASAGFTVSISSSVTGGTVTASSAGVVIEFDYTQNSTTPEPMSMMLVGGGLLGLGLVASKLRKKA
jgi:hypothetical protein